MRTVGLLQQFLPDAPLLKCYPAAVTPYSFAYADPGEYSELNEIYRAVSCVFIWLLASK